MQAVSQCPGSRQAGAGAKPDGSGASVRPETLYSSKSGPECSQCGRRLCGNGRTAMGRAPGQSPGRAPVSQGPDSGRGCCFCVGPGYLHVSGSPCRSYRKQAVPVRGRGQWIRNGTADGAWLKSKAGPAIRRRSGHRRGALRPGRSGSEGPLSGRSPGGPEASAAEERGSSLFQPAMQIRKESGTIGT